jgi:hypothetical protein
MGTRHRIKATVLFALCGALLVAGILISVIGVRGELLYVGSRTWPTTGGSVTYSAAQTEITPWYDFPRSVHGTFRPPGKIRFGVVEYRYVVDGQVHVSRVEVGGIVESGSLVSQFSKGSGVKVFYDPANPERSALMPGIDTAYIGFQLVLAATLFTLAGIGLRGTLRYMRRR